MSRFININSGAISSDESEWNDKNSADSSAENLAETLRTKRKRKMFGKVQTKLSKMPEAKRTAGSSRVISQQFKALKVATEKTSTSSTSQLRVAVRSNRSTNPDIDEGVLESGYRKVDQLSMQKNVEDNFQVTPTSPEMENMLQIIGNNTLLRDAGIDFAREMGRSFHLPKSSSADRSSTNENSTNSEMSHSKDTLLIMKAIRELSLDIQENTRAVNNLCAVVERGIGASDSKQPGFIVKNNLKLPFKTQQDLKDFDLELKDAQYRQDFANCMYHLIDNGNNVSKTVLNILKKFIGREVALNFTAVKQIGNKEIFKNTEFCKIMLDVVTRNHTDNQGNPISEKYFHRCIGHALANAKDWDGYRAHRIRNKTRDDDSLNNE